MPAEPPLGLADLGKLQRKIQLVNESAERFCAKSSKFVPGVLIGRDGSPRSGSRGPSGEPGTLPDGSVATTPVVPVVVGDDWKAVLLWKALFDAGLYTNVALHPAVPPGGALLRTSLMATHEREQLDRALAIFERVIPEFDGLLAD